MLVRDLLEYADVETVAAKYVVRRDYGEGVESRETVAAGMEKFISMLMERTPIITGKNIVVPIRYVMDGEEDLYADLYEKADILAFDTDATLAEMEYRIERARTCPLEELPTLLAGKFIESYGYSFCRWEEVLGFEVYLPDGDPVLAAELAEDVLWEMTFNGMTDEEQDERRAELDELVAELDELVDVGRKQLAEGNAKSFDEVKKELEDKYGIVDKRTPEEKARAKRRNYIEMCQNDLTRTCALLECKAWLTSAEQS